MFEVGRGEHFGDSFVFKQPSIDYFGDMVAVGSGDSDNSVKCWFISYENLMRVPFYELLQMAQHQQDTMQKFVSIAANRLRCKKSGFDMY